MALLKSGLDLLSDGEIGLFIYTRGVNLNVNSKGSGETGWWVLNPERAFDRVFVFVQGEADKPSNILSGWCEKMEGPDEGRYLLHLAGVHGAGQTRVNWKTFAAAGQNPIRFLSRR